MKSLIIFFLATGMLCAQSPENFKVQLKHLDDNERNSESCFNLQLSASQSDNIHLASQNYRLFYNSDNLSFIPNSLDLDLPNDKYQLKLVQERKDVDASGMGQLEFEENLGFINFSVVLQNTQSGGVLIETNDNWMPVANMCFKVDDFSKEQSIVLARSQLTADYGRAFIELSYIGEDSKVETAVIASYTDYKLN